MAGSKKSNSASPPVVTDSASSSPTTNAKAKLPSMKKSFLHNIFSLSTLSTLAAFFYVYTAFSNLLNLMYPLRNIPQNELHSIPKDKKVYPYWGSSSNTDHELGLRVYLSATPDFSLDYFADNDKFGESEDDDNIIRSGNSFLLWSEDNAIDTTKRSFVFVASDDPSSCNTDANDDSDSTQSCNAEEQKSIEFAHKWLEDAIQHEQQLQSDGGGIMAAVNSAGSGIESTSVLLTLYTSIHRNLKSLLSLSGGGESSDDESGGVSKQSKDQVGDDEPKTIYISPQNPVWKSFMSKGTAYVHVLLIRQTPGPTISEEKQQQQSHLISASSDPKSAASRLQQLHSQHNVLFGKVNMIKHEIPLHVPSPKRLLYRDLLFMLKKYIMCPMKDDSTCNTLVPPWNVQYHQPQAHKEYQQATYDKKQGVKYPYWKPEVSIHLIQDEECYPIDYANSVGFDIIQVAGRGRPHDDRHPSGYSYLPAVHVDEIGLTSDKYIALNQTVSALPLRIGFHSGMMDEADDEDQSSTQQGLTPARYRLLNHLSSALESQVEMGFEQSDIDDLRRLIAETNVILLAITILASVLHLLFEFLTFKVSSKP